MQADELILEAVPAGRNSVVTLTARLGGDVIAAEQLNILKPKVRADFAERLTRGWPAIERSRIEAELLRIAGEIADRVKESTGEGTPEAGSRPDVAAALEAMPQRVRDEAEAMLKAPDLVKRIVTDIRTLGVAGEHELTATVYLIGVSRLRPRPLAGIVQGPTASGKTYIVARVADLFPPEAVIHATQMTPQALYHLPPGSLVHRFVVAGERSRIENEDTAEATRALREMISAGRLTKLMPVKKDGGIVTLRIEQDGPIAYVETTTLTRIFEEDLNRCILTQTDEQPEQTRRILKTLAASRDYAAGTNAVEALIQRHHALQRMLTPSPVAFPFAGRLAELFPNNRVEARRAFGHLLSMIETLALLHQRQRMSDADGYLLATADDYALAKRLLDKPLARLLGGRVSDAARRFFDRLTKWASGQDFTKHDAAKHGESAQERTVNGWLSELYHAGYLELVEANRGQQPAKWKIAPDVPASGDAADLPVVEDVFLQDGLPQSRGAQVVVG
jgi:hypothetical protein